MGTRPNLQLQGTFLDTQKDFISREAAEWNKDNLQRYDNNKLAVFKLQESPKRDSNYRADFKPMTIKKDAEVSMLVNKKDHFKSNSKENLMSELSSISEYQRRYDSVMEKTKGGNSSLGLYGKGKTIARKNKE